MHRKAYRLDFIVRLQFLENAIMVICFVGHKSKRLDRIDNSTMELATWQIRIRVSGSGLQHRGRPQWLLAVTFV